jgi:inhibitor of KinA
MNHYHPYTIFPLGDSALIIDFGNEIDEAINKKVLQLFTQLRKTSVPYITDLIPGYSSLAVYYDVLAVHQKKEENRTAFETMAEMVEKLSQKDPELTQNHTRLVEVPVCYSKNFATDIEFISEQNKISVDEIIQLHSSKIYKVFMIGFLPGFAYMGKVDERISLPRKPIPKTVVAGSVGIAGVQTGIYPLESPGGWQIIGRTPLKLFDRDKEQPVLFEPGDEVKFYPITEDEFTNY